MQYSSSNRRICAFTYGFGDACFIDVALLGALCCSGIHYLSQVQSWFHPVGGLFAQLAQRHRSALISSSLSFIDSNCLLAIALELRSRLRRSGVTVTNAAELIALLRP